MGVIQGFGEGKDTGESSRIVGNTRGKPAVTFSADSGVDALLKGDIEMRRQHQRVGRGAGPPSEYVPLRIDLDILQPHATKLLRQEFGPLGFVESGGRDLGNLHLFVDVRGVIGFEVAERLRDRVGHQQEKREHISSMLQRFKLHVTLDSHAGRERLVQGAGGDVVTMDALDRGPVTFIGAHSEADTDGARVGVRGGGKPVISGRNSARLQRTQEGFDQSTGDGRSERAARVRICH
jgi:hypothetical protein